MEVCSGKNGGEEKRFLEKNVAKKFLKKCCYLSNLKKIKY